MAQKELPGKTSLTYVGRKGCRALCENGYTKQVSKMEKFRSSLKFNYLMRLYLNLSPAKDSVDFREHRMEGYLSNYLLRNRI